MGDHHHRHAASRQLTHGIQHLLHTLGVQSAGGFIEEHHLRIEGQGTGDRHALLLTATQLGRIFPGLLSDPHLLEKINRPLLRQRRRHLLDLDRSQGDVVEN